MNQCASCKRTSQANSVPNCGVGLSVGSTAVIGRDTRIRFQSRLLCSRQILYDYNNKLPSKCNELTVQMQGEVLSCILFA